MPGGSSQEAVLEAVEGLLDPARQQFGLLRVRGSQGAGVAPSPMAEDDAEAIASSLDVCHTVLPRIVSGRRLAVQRRKRNVTPIVFPVCSQRGPETQKGFTPYRRKPFRIKVPETGLEPALPVKGNFCALNLVGASWVDIGPVLKYVDRQGLTANQRCLLRGG